MIKKERFRRHLKKYNSSRKLAVAIANLNLGAISEILFHLSHFLAETAFKDLDNQKIKLGEELLRLSQELFLIAERLGFIWEDTQNKYPNSKNYSKNIKFYSSNKFLAEEISELSYKSIGKIISNLGLEISKIAFSDEDKGRFPLSRKLLKISQDLYSLGSEIKEKIWEKICKRYTEEF